MTKEELSLELSEQMTTLEAHAMSMAELLKDLQLTVRPSGDVTFTAMDKSKEVLDHMTETRRAMEKVRSVLKARAIARMREDSKKTSV